MKESPTLQEKRYGQERETHPWTDHIERMAAGDESALQSLYETSKSLIYGVTLRILGDAAAAEEAALDAYLQAWRSAATYQSDRGTPAAWLVTLARSRAIDRKRSSARQRGRFEPLDGVAEMASEAPSPLEEHAQAERRQAVLVALEQLSPDQREAIGVAYYAGLSHREIATALEEPLGTVKTRIRLGMMKLRELLADQNEGG